jgi:hypothetical protein
MSAIAAFTASASEKTECEWLFAPPNWSAATREDVYRSRGL